MNDEIRDKIIEHNLKFPYDRIWRKKYSIPFNSLRHKEISFLSQLYDLEEDKFFEELNSEDKYIPNTGDWLKTQQSDSGSIEDSVASFRDEFKDVE